MKDRRLSVVEEYDWGVYVWQLPDGTYLADDDANFLNIPAKFGDRAKIKRLAEVAAHYGYPDGTAVFSGGSRQINDEEFWEQICRLEAGLTPDPYDIGAMSDELKYKKAHGFD